MSWCTAAQVAELITVARLRGDVDQSTRKQADLQFLELCANAVNAGDALVQVATEAAASPGLRLNALFAAETLFTARGWCEGAQFSDRSAVTQRLLHITTADPAFNPHGKVDAGLVRCLAFIIALEFPTTEWAAWLQQCAVGFVASDARCHAALRAVVAESYRNYALWGFLANDLTRFLLEADASTVPQRTAVTELCLDLMRKRPRPSAEHEIASEANCFLLSASMRQAVLTALQARVEEAPGEGSGPATAAFLADCTASFAVASRLTVDAESAAVVFACASFFLVHVQAAVAESPAARDLAEQLLECLLSTLQLFPDVASAGVSADALLSCLIAFMIRTDAAEPNDAAQLSAELLEYFMDDEAVPLGCGSGDVAHLAAAVLELYLEHNAAQRALAVVALNALLRATPVMSGRLVDAVALALRAVSRVYEASDAVVVDALAGDVQADLLSQVSQLLLRTTDAHAHAMLVDAMTHCFYRSTNQALCTQLVHLLQQLYAASAATAAENECGVCVRYTCVYAAGRLVDELRGRDWCGQLLSTEWIQLAMQQLCSGDAFGVFSAAYTLCTLLCVAPLECGAQLSSSLAVWERGLEQLCRHATLRSTAALLTLTLKHLAGLSVPRSADHAPHVCHELLPHSCQVVFGCCRDPSPSRHLVLRSLADFSAAYTRALLHGEAAVTAHAEHVAAVGAALLATDFAADLAQDESSCRGYAVFAGLHVRAFGTVQPASGPVAVGVLTSVLEYAARQPFASQTLSAVGSQLAWVLLRCPAHLDEAAPRVLHTVFGGRQDLGESRKGVNYGGVVLLVSLLLVRQPRALLQRGGDSTKSADAAMQRAFGWWLSLATFMDAPQFLFFTAASCRLVDAVAGLQPQEREALAGLAACQQYLLPSTHVKKLPARPFAGGHVLQHLALAWADIECRYSRTSKPQLFDKDLLPAVMAVEGSYEQLSGQAFAPSTACALWKASPAETTAAVLAHLEQLGWGALVEGARQQVRSTRA